MTSTLLLLVIYLAFISLGLPDGVFGVAWPSLRLDFGMPIQMAGVATTILMCCSAISSFRTGHWLRRFGAGQITFLSCLMTGLALVGFSVALSFWWLLVLVIPLGFGQGAVDSSLNNYVANNYSSRHMNWLHCFWGMGATLGPAIMAGVLAGGYSWRIGYSRIGSIQLGLALVLLMSLRFWRDVKAEPETGKSMHAARSSSLLRSWPAWLAVLMFFVYAGTEFSVGLWANSLLVEARGLPKDLAGFWISYYYGALMLGRLATGVVVNRLGNRLLIRIGLLVAAVGIVLMAVPTASAITVAGLVLIGMGFAPIYPCMMHETPRRFGKEDSQVLIGYQVGSAYVGGSALAAGVGWIMSGTTLESLATCLLIFVLSMVAMSEGLNRLGLRRGAEHQLLGSGDSVKGPLPR